MGRAGPKNGVRTDGRPPLSIIVCEDNISKHFIEVTGNYEYSEQMLLTQEYTTIRIAVN